MKEALYILGDVIHTLQRERGCTAVFLYSEGRLFSERMLTQFTCSDDAVKSLQEGLEHWYKTKSLKGTQIEKLNVLLDICLQLSEWRNKVAARDVSASDSIGHYSHQLIGPFLQHMVEIALYMEGNDPACVSVYNAFLQWKERIGLERTIGARGFIGYSFHNQEFVERISFLLSEQNSYQNTYLALANEVQKKLIHDALKKSESSKLDQLHEALKQPPDSGILHDLTPGAWFDLISTKIDTLHEAEKHLVDSLSKERKEQPKEIMRPVPPAPENKALKKQSDSMFGEYDNFISSLQLFSGLSKEYLYTLLRHSQIRDFKKGKLLFLEGEPANRLYIILKGWIKVFKGTAGGEETILQMFSAGDAIMESAVFLNTVFPVSAQVVEDATLLSLPAPVLREQLKNDNELALNLLAAMSHRSQGLIRQIENARLKSVDERIGWFLLKLLLDQGHISRCVKLPYDKSLIASYLGMKRETFSRALKRLTEKGIKIENDTVIIPNLGILCGFCDQDTASQCTLHNTSNCPNSQHGNAPRAHI